MIQRGCPGGSVVKNPLTIAGDAGDAVSIPGSGRSPGVGNGSPFQYPCLENPMDTEEPGGLQSRVSQRVGHNWACLENPLGRGEWRVIVLRVAKSKTWLKRLNVHTSMHDWLSTHSTRDTIECWQKWDMSRSRRGPGLACEEGKVCRWLVFDFFLKASGLSVGNWLSLPAPYTCLVSRGYVRLSMATATDAISFQVFLLLSSYPCKI